eukprot:scaffold16000_cov19-Tisochrysis_lutea.AAC.2
MEQGAHVHGFPGDDHVFAGDPPFCEHLFLKACGPGASRKGCIMAGCCTYQPVLQAQHIVAITAAWLQAQA